jgi:hypothetical protein
MKFPPQPVIGDQRPTRCLVFAAHRFVRLPVKVSSLPKAVNAALPLVAAQQKIRCGGAKCAGLFP